MSWLEYIGVFALVVIAVNVVIFTWLLVSANSPEDEE